MLGCADQITGSDLDCRTASIAGRAHRMSHLRTSTPQSTQDLLHQSVGYKCIGLNKHVRVRQDRHAYRRRLLAAVSAGR